MLSTRQTCYLSPDRPPELGTQDMVSPVCHSIPMDIDTIVGATAEGQGMDL